MNKYFELLNKKEVRCRFCGKLIDFTKGFECSCGIEIDMDDVYVIFKNGDIVNYYDYCMDYLPKDNIEKAMKIVEKDLKDRRGE